MKYSKLMQQVRKGLLNFFFETYFYLFLQVKRDITDAWYKFGPNYGFEPANSALYIFIKLFYCVVIQISLLKHQC